MKNLSSFVVAASLLSANIAFAKPIFGISLQPVRAVTTNSAGSVTVVGNMPGRKQVNQARFNEAADALGCRELAVTAASTGKGFTIFGEASGLYAEAGKFTMEFVSITDCYLY